MKIALFGIASLLALGGYTWMDSLSAAPSAPSLTADMKEKDKNMESSGCKGCFCCFPRTPDGNVILNGFEAITDPEKVVYTSPEDKWFILTDLEVVVLDSQGNPTSTYNVGLFEEDAMGMRALKRWANCSPYHSARGIAIRPGCDVILAELSQVPVGTTPTADRYYWQLNGYLWDGATGSH